MPLDPNRFVAHRLADLAHTLTIPNTGRLFAQDEAGEPVDIYDPFWRALIADGSIVAAEPPAERKSTDAPHPEKPL